MLRRILIAIAVAVLAALGIFAATTQKAATSSPNPSEAARLNNLGAAYMNQQLFEKGLKSFQEAAALDPALQVAALNQGIALLNLTRIDPAKALIEEPQRRSCLVQSRIAVQEFRQSPGIGGRVPARHRDRSE